MSDQNAGSASTQESSGLAENQTNDKVAYETYKRVLNEAKKLREQNKLYEDERNKNREDVLKEQNQWKPIAETYKSKYEEAQKLLEQQNSDIINGRKFDAFEKRLGGKIKDKDLAYLIEFDKIAINPETNMVDEASVDGVVSTFAKKYSYAVDFNAGGRMPNEAARNATFGVKDPKEMSAQECADELRKLGKL